MPRIPSCLRVVLTISDQRRVMDKTHEVGNDVGCERTEDALVARLAKDRPLCL